MAARSCAPPWPTALPRWGARASWDRSEPELAHLGDDVSAFVDGQLSPRAAKAAERHLSHCAACRGVVDLHQQTKARMQLGTRRPDVPLSLLQTLSNLPDEAPAAGPLPRRRRWWARLGRSRGLGAGVVVVGASFAVVATAYLAGARPAEADPVAPSFDSYAADFADGYGTAQDTMTVAAMSRLDSNGFKKRAFSLVVKNTIGVRSTER
ncbi:MAG: zf-HC2 domain-containing protein [Actinomycetales bacterium]|nr:MAG: zf-HC2 domain-containing protein [Actinomycetales bacterium]